MALFGRHRIEAGVVTVILGLAAALVSLRHPGRGGVCLRRHASLYLWGTSSQGGSMLMHRATKPIVLAVSAVFGLGLVTAAAANSHGEAVSDKAHASKALVSEARGDAVSGLAKTNGRSARSTTA